MERQREELRKEKERRLKTEKAIGNSYNNVEQVFDVFDIHVYLSCLMIVVKPLRQWAFSLPLHLT